MNGERIRPLLGLLVLLIAPAAPGHASDPSSSPGRPPGLRALTGDDAQRAQRLDEQIDQALKEDRWVEAIARAEELLAVRAQVQGLKHFETINVEWRLKTLRRVAALPKDDRVACRSAADMTEQARKLHEQGKYAVAQPLLGTALVIRRKFLAGDDPEIARTCDQAAVNLLYLGKYAEAEPLYREALGICQRVLGEEHPGTARGYNGLADVLDAQRRHAEAEPLLQKALAIRRRTLGEEHPDTAQTINDVGSNLEGQGKLARADPQYRQALAIRRRVLGEDHPSTATSYNNVANNLRDQGKYAQAQPLFEKALEIHRRTLTDDHADTAIYYSNVAQNLAEQGKYAQAQPLLEKALEITRRLLTDDHPITATSYTNLAGNLAKQGKYAQAQPLLEKALESWRRRLSDDHPDTATGYRNLAYILKNQGKYAQAQRLDEKALEIHRRLLGDDHPDTARTGHYLAANLNAQGKYLEAQDRWLSAVKNLDKARLQVAFTGLERVGTKESVRPALAAVLARLGRPKEAWQRLEEGLGRGLLDELAARQDWWLAPSERTRLRELTTALERLDRLVETTPKRLDQAERAKRFEDLKQQRALASIALGEFQTKLVQEHDVRSGQVAKLNEIQSALPDDAALVAWVDLAPVGPKAADPDGERWGVVVRSRGMPNWVSIAGTGPDGLWTQDDTELANRVRTELRSRPGASPRDLRPLIERLRTQRLEPLARALGGTADGLPPVRRLIVLPSRALAGIPIEALLAPNDTRTVSYAPSGTVFKYLLQQPRPDRHAGLLALGDPIHHRPDPSKDPQPLPDHGLLVDRVVPGSNAAKQGLKPGDVLLAYKGTALHQRDDLKAVPEPGPPVAVQVWRDGQVVQRDLTPGKLGVVLDPRPAPQAIAERRRMQQVLVAARSGDEDLAPLPGTRDPD